MAVLCLVPGVWLQHYSLIPLPFLQLQCHSIQSFSLVSDKHLAAVCKCHSFKKIILRCFLKNCSFCLFVCFLKKSLLTKGTLKGSLGSYCFLTSQETIWRQSSSQELTRLVDDKLSGRTAPPLTEAPALLECRQRALRNLSAMDFSASEFGKLFTAVTI